MDEAIEAGLLVGALRAMPQLIVDCEREVTGELAPGHTAWKTLAFEMWGRDHDDDSGQERIGPGIALPPSFAVRALRAVQGQIVARLFELGVSDVQL